MNRSAQAAFSDTERVVDGVTSNVGNNGRFYWYGGEGPPQPDWIQLSFDKAAEVQSVRLLLPIDEKRFPGNGHEPLDYELVGLFREVKSKLVTVKNGKHPETEPGPIDSVQWVVVNLQSPKMLDGIQFITERTSGGNLYGPVVFEIEVMASKPAIK